LSIDRPAGANPLNPERQAQARRYARLRRWLSAFELGFSTLLLLLLVFTSLSESLAGRLGLPNVLSAVVYFLFLLVAYSLITAPLSYYTDYVLPRRYGLSTQKFPGWLMDQFKGLLLSLVLGAGLVAAIYWLLDLSPGLWWLWTWVVSMTVSLILSVLMPVLILPLFYKTRPLQAGVLRTRLEELVAKSGLKVKGIYTAEFSAKTTTANAALMGLGSTRRIVLADTIIGRYTPEEIVVVMGHEIGHQHNRDMLRLFCFQGTILLVTFYVTSLLLRLGVDSLGYKGINDPAALPLLLLISGVMGLLSGPALAAFTRTVESQADRYALDITQDPASFISSMSRLTDQNLAEASPPRWVELLMEDHPSYRQRVAMARRYAAMHDLPAEVASPPTPAPPAPEGGQNQPATP
jgi:STE24 endopeptidase